MIVGAGAATLCTAILVRDLKHRPQSDAQALEFRAPALEQAASVQQWQRDHRSPPFFFSWDLEMMGGFVHDVAPPFHVTTDAGCVCVRITAALRVVVRYDAPIVARLVRERPRTLVRLTRTLQSAYNGRG